MGEGLEVGVRAPYACADVYARACVLCVDVEVSRLG